METQPPIKQLPLAPRSKGIISPTVAKWVSKSCKTQPASQVSTPDTENPYVYVYVRKKKTFFSSDIFYILLKLTENLIFYFYILLIFLSSYIYEWSTLDTAAISFSIFFSFCLCLSLSLAFVVHPYISPKHYGRYFFVSSIQILLFSFSFYGRILFRFTFSNSLICPPVFLHFTTSITATHCPGSFSIILFFLRSLKLTSLYLLLPFRSFLPPHSSNIFLSSHFLFSTILLVFPPFSLLVFLSVFLVLYNNKNYNRDRKTILIAFV